MSFKPYKLPTAALYKMCDFIFAFIYYRLLNIVPRLHQIVVNDSRNLDIRRKYNVAKLVKTKTDFVARQLRT